jgi:ABC-type branched-subunit amino acid transport system substrate-binding protein
LNAVLPVAILDQLRTSVASNGTERRMNHSFSPAAGRTSRNSICDLRPTRATCLCVLICCLSGCTFHRPLSEVAPSKAEEAPLIIAVVGSGVSRGDAPNPAMLDLNWEQGWAMWSGAQTAYLSSAFEDLRDVVQLQPYDDDGNPETAREIAKKLRSNPRVLAIVGHATSGTTKSAAPLYAGAGIPLLMPIATSPEASINAGGSRYANCFRLPLNDRNGQAPAIAWVVENQLKSKHPVIIIDKTRDAAVYSQPLAEAVRRVLGLSDNSIEVLEERADSADLAISLRSRGYDVAIFCGYGSTATSLLGAVSEVYENWNNSHPQQKKPLPQFILTDGCMSANLRLHGVPALLTFPAPNSQHVNGKEVCDALNDTIKSDNDETYQVYGYDALMILAESLKDLRDRKDPGGRTLSRRSLMLNLETKERFSSGCLSYSFKEGENLDGAYYIYECLEDANGTLVFQPAKEHELNRVDLDEYRE